MHQQLTQTILFRLLLGALLTFITSAAIAQSSPSLQSILANSGKDEVIPVEKAYQLNAKVAGPQELRLSWKIAQGTYLYQEKIKLKIKQGDGITLGEYKLPSAKIKKNALRPDGTTGDLPVYYHRLHIPVPLIRTNNSATTITLEVSYQGCADFGFCYPPQRKQVRLDLPPFDGANPTSPSSAASPPGTTVDQAGPASELDSLIAILRGGNYWLIIGVFLLAGLGLALTPCIFPMIPILSGIIIGQGKEITTGKAFTISLVYVLAMAIVYTIAGVLAGMFGENLQAAFQNPWILSIFAGLFVLLALSMFGFYDLQLPRGLQGRLTEISNKQQGGTLIGAAIMGALSALIVGPCVAPALAAAILVIGQSGDPVLGGVALFALSMGMGAPILAFGTSSGKLLPKVGSWMDIVKSVFGVAMLAVAIIMLERIIPATISMVLWGTLLVVSSIYLGALHELPVEASGWQRLWKGLGVVIMIYGTLMLVGAAAGGKDTVQPLRGIVINGSTAQQQHLNFKPIKSEADLTRELKIASSQNRPVMLDFSADWCVTCKEMERYTFSDPEVIKALEGFVLLQADVTANDEIDKRLLQGRFGMPGPPSIMFFDRNGREQKKLRVVGFVPATEFATHVKQAAKQ
jgi:thiol:disulfide interchange protein DsbD